MQIYLYFFDCAAFKLIKPITAQSSKIDLINFSGITHLICNLIKTMKIQA